jgi:hypothetical protein
MAAVAATAAAALAAATAVAVAAASTADPAHLQALRLQVFELQQRALR